MSLSKNNYAIAGATLLAFSFTLPSPVNAQSRYFDKLEGKNLGELRTEVEKRLKDYQSGSTQVRGDEISSNGTTIKIDRAGIRSMIDRYLPK